MMNSEIKILAEEKDYIVILKPRGKECEKEIPEMLKESFGELYCVHRLDKYVSGVMVYARTKKGAGYLSREIQEKSFKKTYLALLTGRPEKDEDTFKDFLFKDGAKNKAYIVRNKRKGVKEAVLSYKTKKYFETENISLVEIQLDTGRFHQIRAQMSYRGLSLIGDRKYGGRDYEGFNGIMLFCERIDFTDLEKGEVSFSHEPDFPDVFK